jgi:peptidoglycan/LPS O-acetylase OafA/YrhL
LVAHPPAVWSRFSDTAISLATHQGFIAELPVFMAGVLVYFLIRDTKLNKLVAEVLLVIAGIACIVMTAYPHVGWFTMHTYYAMFFATIAYCVSQGAGAFLINRLSTLIGKVSYSGYFVHFAILAIFGPSIAELHLDGLPGMVMMFCGLSVVTIALSLVTYRYVEQPMIGIGSKMISQRWHRAVFERLQEDAPPFSHN